jgi:hypothetical protein
MVQAAWDDAHKELKIVKEDYVGDPTDREVNLVCDLYYMGLRWTLNVS